MMHRRLAAIVAALGLLLSAPTYAAKPTIISRPDADSLSVPAGSPLHFRTFDKDNTAKFDGKIMISGTYYYDAGEDADGAVLHIVPDRETWSRLPHYKDHGTPDEIYFSNALAFAKAVNLVKSRRTLTGQTQIWADRFEAGIECDVPFFNARFVELAKPAVKLAAKDLEDNGC